MAAEVPKTIENARVIPIMSTARPKKTCATLQPAPNPQTSRIVSYVAERYTIDRFEMVTRAAARGRTTSANIVQASQVLSQARLQAYFMGIVKLAFMMPAIIRVAIPLAALLMIVSFRSALAAQV
jgi:hypothetical protein